MPYLSGLFEQILLGGFFQCISPDGFFDDADDLFRFVLKSPFFFERTFTIGTAGDGPIYF